MHRTLKKTKKPSECQIFLLSSPNALLNLPEILGLFPQSCLVDTLTFYSEFSCLNFVPSEGFGSEALH